MRLGSLVLFLAASAFAQPAPAYLHVTIVDSTGALIANSSVKVASDTTKCEAKINNEFKYVCAVTPGTYTLTADIPGFFPEKRTGITLPAGQNFVKLHPVINGLGIALIVDEKGLHDVIIPSREPDPKIEERRINGTDVLIRYKEMNKSDGLLHFRGPYLMLTSNLLAVYAEVIACTETFQSCTAEGNVRVETGTGEEMEGTQADIDLLNHKFKLTRAATVEQSF